MLKTILKVLVTLAVLALAAVLAWVYWSQYLLNPWTRDGQAQAYVVGIAARVSGPMIDVPVQDNQYVKEGDLLFAIDPTDYQQDVDAAKASLNKAQTTAELLKLEIDRRTPLLAQQLISLEEYQVLQAKYAEALAEIEVQASRVQLSELNLSYTRVYAPVNGYVTNLVVTTGTYVTKGQPLMALVDADDFWIVGYFRETDLKGVTPGKRAEVRFMGHYGEPLDGVVQSVGWGIFRPDGAEGQNLLPVVAPTVDWVRLAQRFPVRVHLINPPADLPLRVGATASVLILPDEVEYFQEPLNGHTLTDGRGDPVVLVAEPQRIISLAPSTTELVYALDAGDRLIADTEFCLYPAAARELPHIQGFDSPNPEILLSLQPDLVLASDITRPATVSRLRELGLPVFVLPSKGLDGLENDIGLLGNVLGRDEAAADLLTRFAQVRAQLGMRFAGLSEEERPRVFLAYGERETYTAGPGTFPDQLIHEAGGRNIAYDVNGDWVELSLETLAERDPQVILLPGEPSAPVEPTGEALLADYRADPLWGRLTAVREGRVYVIDNTLFNIPGPRLTQALLSLADTLHPPAQPVDAASPTGSSSVIESPSVPGEAGPAVPALPVEPSEVPSPFPVDNPEAAFQSPAKEPAPPAVVDESAQP
jgi:RND family efflux transporter MFP subunit